VIVPRISYWIIKPAVGTLKHYATIISGYKIIIVPWLVHVIRIVIVDKSIVVHDHATSIIDPQISYAAHVSTTIIYKNVSNLIDTSVSIIKYGSILDLYHGAISIILHKTVIIISGIE
jgi:hypothetical protein